MTTNSAKDSSASVEAARQAILKSLEGKVLDEIQLGLAVKAGVDQSVKGSHISLAIQRLIAEGRLSRQAGVYKII